MDGFENEKIIVESKDKRLRLTSHRIRYYQTNKRTSNMMSLPLDKISSIEVGSKNYIIFLVIGAIGLLGTIGYFLSEPHGEIEILAPAFLFFVLLLIFYFRSRKHTVSINTDGNKSLVFYTRGMKRDFIDNFINDAEKASFKLKKEITKME